MLLFQQHSITIMLCFLPLKPKTFHVGYWENKATQSHESRSTEGHTCLQSIQCACRVHTWADAVSISYSDRFPRRGTEKRGTRKGKEEGQGRKGTRRKILKSWQFSWAHRCSLLLSWPCQTKADGRACHLGEKKKVFVNQRGLFFEKQGFCFF